MLYATAKGEHDRSNSILVSFDVRWEDAFLNDRISVIFRKMVPRNVFPKMLYVYIKRPSSKVIGRTKINEIRHVALDEAFGLAKRACIAPQELKEYIGSLNKIGVYFIEDFELAPTYASLKSIWQYVKFYPAQSFQSLSIDFKALIDKMCSFSEENR